MTPLERQRDFIAHLTKGEMITRKVDFQDVRVSGARHALEAREPGPQAVIMTGDSNGPFFPSSLPKMMTVRLSPTIRSWKTIPLGSSISITGKSKARALRKMGSWTCLMTRAMSSSLPTSTSMLAPLPRQGPGTAGDQAGMIVNRDIPMRLIGRSFRAMTGRFSRTMCTSLRGLITLKLLRDIPLLKKGDIPLYFNIT